MSADELQKKLESEIERLSREVADLKKLDLDAILETSTSRRSKSDSDASQKKKPKHEKPDWVKEYEKKNHSHGEVRHVVKTTETFHEATGKIDSKTELIDPPVKTVHAREAVLTDDGKIVSKVVERVVEVGLPEHLRLGVQHDEREPRHSWATRPTHDGLLRRDLPLREALAELQRNPGNPLDHRDEGPTKPVRKQMTRMNKVWKYRNFKKCQNCEAFDTWEARVDPYKLENVGVVHAEIWCHTCGAVDYDVVEDMPDRESKPLGSWVAPKESPKELTMKEKRRVYREERTVFSLREGSKTAMELLIWFRDVEGYSAVDLAMIEIMLKRMREQGRVKFDRASGKWSNK